MNNHRRILPLLSTPRSRGINLIELLIALAIIFILTLLAVPLFINLIQNYRLSATADLLQYNIQFVRSKAVENNANVYISFTTGDTWCYGMNSGSACDCSNPSSCGLGTVSYSQAQRMSLSTTGMGSNSIYFEGSHGAANSSGSVTFTKYGSSSPLVTITIGRLGNTQICSTGISGYTAC